MEVAFGRAAQVVIGLGVVCSGAELAARALDPEATHAADELVPPHLLRPDDRLGWAHEAGAVGVSVRTGREVTYRINAAGLRDEPTPHTPAPGIYRILLIGGGAAFGEGVAIEEHFSVGIERDLEQVEVANLAVAGHSPAQMLLRLRGDGMAYSPDLVLAFVEGRTRSRAARSNPKAPRFSLEHGDLVLTPAPRGGGDLAGRVGSRLQRWLARHSCAYHLLGEAASGVRATNGTLRFPRAVAADDDRPSRAEELDRLRALVMAMDDEAADGDAAFLLVTRSDALHAEARSRGVTSLAVGDLLENPMFQLPGTLGSIDARGHRALTRTLTAFLRESGLLAPQHWRTL